MNVSPKRTLPFPAQPRHFPGKGFKEADRQTDGWKEGGKGHSLQSGLSVESGFSSLAAPTGNKQPSSRPGRQTLSRAHGAWGVHSWLCWAGCGQEPSGTATSFPCGQGRRPAGVCFTQDEAPPCPRDLCLPGAVMRARGGSAAETRTRVLPAAHTWPRLISKLTRAGRPPCAALGGCVLSPGGRSRLERPAGQEQGSCCKCWPPGARGTQAGPASASASQGQSQGLRVSS